MRALGAESITLKARISKYEVWGNMQVITNLRVKPHIAETGAFWQETGEIWQEMPKFKDQVIFTTP